MLKAQGSSHKAQGTNTFTLCLVPYALCLVPYALLDDDRLTLPDFNALNSCWEAEGCIQPDALRLFRRSGVVAQNLLQQRGGHRHAGDRRGLNVKLADAVLRAKRARHGHGQSTTKQAPWIQQTTARASFRYGVEIDHDRGAVADHMAERDLEITIDLGLGAGRYTVLTNDLTHAYVDENMGTS